MAKGLRADSCFQRRHLHRRQCRLKSLVSHLQSSAIDRLLQSLASQHPKRMRHARLLRGLPNPPRNLIDDDVVMRRIPAQQTTQTKDGDLLPRQSQHPRRHRNLERPRHPHNRNVFLLRSRAQQSIIGAQQQPLRDERVKPRHHNCKPLPGGVDLPFERGNRGLRRSLYIQFEFLVRDSVPRCDVVRESVKIRANPWPRLTCP